MCGAKDVGAAVRWAPNRVPASRSSVAFQPRRASRRDVRVASAPFLQPSARKDSSFRSINWTNCSRRRFESVLVSLNHSQSSKGRDGKKYIIPAFFKFLRHFFYFYYLFFLLKSTTLSKTKPEREARDAFLFGTQVDVLSIHIGLQIWPHKGLPKLLERTLDPPVFTGVQGHVEQNVQRYILYIVTC